VSLDELAHIKLKTGKQT